MTTFRFYRKHWLLRATEDGRLHTNAKRLWPSLNHASGCVIAYEGGKMVGFLRWLGAYSQGTWVAPTHRRKGVALALWSRMLERRRPRKFQVTTVTSAGRRFARELARRFPGVAWKLVCK